MLIGIHGKQGAGKDEAGKIILNELRKQGVYAIRRGFGDFVKEIYMEATGLPWDEIERNKPAHRENLQDLGHELRAMFPNIWINKMKKAREIGETTIIPDVRYPNEYDYISQKGFVIKIHADRETRNVRRELRREHHESETAMDHIENEKYFAVIENEGTQAQLEAQIKALIRSRLVEILNYL